MQLEFFFDFSCPYAYLGSTQIEAIADRHGADLIWKPMLLGGVFRAVETPMNLATHQSPQKVRHNGADMHRWAELWHVPLVMPSAHPMRTVRALRTVLACQKRRWPKLIAALFEAYWVKSMDMCADATIEWALTRGGITGEEAEEALSAHQRDDIKADLRVRTDEAVERGVFGAPTTFLSGEDVETPLMFWGQDRLHMVEAVLQGWRPPDHKAPPPKLTHVPASPSETSEPPQIDFWYDFSSPFAYLGSSQIEALAARVGATLRWRPMLLGGLFKSLGTPNVPLLEMSQAKRNYQGQELMYWSSYWQVALNFPTHFPLRTVTPLRLALLAGERIAELSALLFHAAWVEDQDIGKVEVLLKLLNDNHFDGPELLRASGRPETKKLLRSNTEEAQKLGIFGVPTCIVTVAGQSQLYWGQDRLALLEQRLHR